MPGSGLRNQYRATSVLLLISLEICNFAFIVVVDGAFVVGRSVSVVLAGFRWSAHLFKVIETYDGAEPLRNGAYGRGLVGDLWKSNH